MPNSKKTAEQNILGYLKDVVAMFPTDQQKRELTENLELINRHISDLRERINRLPTDMSKAELVNAINVLDKFLTAARDNPPVASALGLPFKRPSNPSSRKSSNSLVGERLLMELRQLPTGDIQSRLLDYKAVSMADLRALASTLGMKASERVKRVELVDQIVKLGFANVRGYENLRSPGASVR